MAALQAATGRHKRQDSELPINECPWLPLQNAARSAQPTVVGATRIRNSPLLASRENSGVLVSAGTVATTGSHEDTTVPSSVLEGTLKYRGVKVRVKSSHTGISWKPAAGGMSRCLQVAALKSKIAYDEVLGAWTSVAPKRCSCFCRVEHSVTIAALSRPSSNPSHWKLKEHKLVAPSADSAKEWVVAVTSALQLCYDRPRALLVFVNPVSGSRRAKVVWDKQAAPVFSKAGIKTHVVETLHADYARSMLASMKAEELAQYQGVVAVGGDGVFQECMIGLCAQRSRGGKNASIAARMRVGHIPGGSTDAVAYTLHGTRSAEAAALHIALGDRLALDVARVDCVAPVIAPATTTAAVGSKPSNSLATEGSSDMTLTCDSETEVAGPTDPSSLGRFASSGLALPEQSLGIPGSFLGSKSVSNSGNAKQPLPAIISGHVMQYIERMTTGGSGDLSQALCCPHVTSSSACPTMAWPDASKSSRHARGAGQTSGKPAVAVAAATIPASGTAAVGLPGATDPSTVTQPVVVVGPEGIAHNQPAVPGPLASRYFVCQAAYGFLGDVMHFSEKLRFMGPTRYDVSGFIQFLRLRSYHLCISYRPALIKANDKAGVCSAKCETCRLAGINLAGVDDTAQLPATLPVSTPAQVVASGSITGQPLQATNFASRLANNPGLLTPSETALNPPGSSISVQSGASPRSVTLPGSHPCLGIGDALVDNNENNDAASCVEGNASGWVTVQGEYISVMAVVTPCRSDKSKHGIVPHAHLSDGRISLVLVSRCNRLQYLRFLLRLSSRGLEDNCFPFVKIIPVTGALIKPAAGAKESCWNVDGELLPTNAVRMKIQRGMVDVFARGVELHVPFMA